MLSCERLNSPYPFGMKTLPIYFAALLVSFVARAEDAKIAVGVYFNENKIYCPADEEAFKDLQAQTSRLAKVYMNFQTWNKEWNSFSARLATNARTHDGVFMVVWMPGAEAENASPDWSCAAIAKGKQDDYIRQYATDLKKFGHPIMLRFAHEMNGTWYPWGTGFNKKGERQNGNDPAAYVAMWRHVWGIFKSVGASNAYWVWSTNLLFLNAQNSLAQQQADFAALYPGDEYVDWIGLDGYNNGTKAKWKSFSELFGDSYKTITALTQKPFTLAEFGCSEKGAPAGTSKAAWIKQAYEVEIPAMPRILLVNWFDRDKTKQGETDWRFNSSPEALSAYYTAVNSPRYQGDVNLEHR